MVGPNHERSRVSNRTVLSAMWNSPARMASAIRMIPPPLMAEFRLRATERSERPRSYIAAAAIVLCWLACAAALAYALWRAAPLAGAWVASP